MPKPTNTNSNGHIQMSPKYLTPENYNYLKEIAKKLNRSETFIVNESLKLHREKSKVKLEPE